MVHPTDKKGSTTKKRNAAQREDEDDELKKPEPTQPASGEAKPAVATDSDLKPPSKEDDVPPRATVLMSPAPPAAAAPARALEVEHVLMPSMSPPAAMVPVTIIFVVAKCDVSLSELQLQVEGPEGKWQSLPLEVVKKSTPLRVEAKTEVDLANAPRCRLLSPGVVVSSYDDPAMRVLYGQFNVFVSVKKFGTLNFECTAEEYSGAIVAAMKLLTRNANSKGQTLGVQIDEARNCVRSWPTLTPLVGNTDASRFLPETVLNAGTAMSADQLVMMAIKHHALGHKFVTQRHRFPFLTAATLKIMPSPIATTAALSSLSVDDRAIVLNFTFEWLAHCCKEGAPLNDSLLRWFAFAFEHKCPPHLHKTLVEHLSANGQVAEFLRQYPHNAPPELSQGMLTQCKTLSALCHKAAELSSPSAAVEAAATSLLGHRDYPGQLRTPEIGRSELAAAHEIIHFMKNDSIAKAAAFLGVAARSKLFFSGNAYLADLPPEQAIAVIAPFISVCVESDNQSALKLLVDGFKDFTTKALQGEDDESRMIRLHRITIAAHTAGGVHLVRRLRETLSTLRTKDDNGLVARIKALQAVGFELPEETRNAECDEIKHIASSVFDPRFMYTKVKKAACEATEPVPISRDLMRLFLRSYRVRMSRLMEDAKGHAFYNALTRSGIRGDSFEALVAVLSNEDVRQYYETISADGALFPGWSTMDECRSASEICTRANTAAESIRDAVAAKTCTADFIDALNQYVVTLPNLSKLPLVMPYDEEELKKVSNHLWRLKDAWEQHVELVNSLARVASVRRHAEPLVRRAREDWGAMQAKPLHEWEAPAVVEGGQAVLDAYHFWRLAQQSPVAAMLEREECDRHADGAPLAETPLNPFASWVQAVEQVKVRWVDTLVKGDTLSVVDIRRFFDFAFPHHLSSQLNANDRDNERALDLALCRKRTAEFIKRREEEVGQRLRSEAELLLQVLPATARVLKGSLDDHVANLLAAILALVDVPVVQAAVQCCETLKVVLPPDAAEIKVCRIDLEASTGREVATLVRAVSTQRQGPLQCPRHFFPALQVALEHGLLNLFGSFLSTHQLSQTIFDRTNHAEARDLEHLNAFESIHRAFSATEGVQQNFVQLVKGKLNSAANFFKYCEEVSWCADTLKANGKALGRVQELLADEIDHDNAVATVLELSLPTTTFYVRIMPDRTSLTKVDLSATTEKRGHDKPYTAADLEDVFFQLTIAGSNAEQNKADAVAHYVHKYQTVKSLVAICEELAVAGHPKYQDQEISCSMALNTEDIEEKIVAVLRRELAEWTSFMDRAETHLPLLALLQPHELVECVQAVQQQHQGQPDVARLAETLVHALLPLASKANVQDLIAPVMSVAPQSMTDALKIIYDAMRAAMSAQSVRLSADEALLARAKVDFASIARQRNLLDRFTEDIDADITVLQIPQACAPLAASLAVAMYGVVFDRTPSAIELLVCEEATAHAPSFVRRWAASLHHSLPGKRLLFGIAGVERLPAKEQAALLDAIVRLRRERVRGDRAAPKLFLVAADRERESVLTAQLRTVTVALTQQDVEVAAQVVRAYCAKAPIRTVSSDRPSSGKTLAAMRHALELDRRFGSAITDGSTASFVEHVHAINSSRRERENIVLHLSVAHNACGSRINDQILEYFVLGRVSDGRHATALRAETDVIIVELPSQGALHTTFAKEVPVLGWFRRLECPATLLLQTVRLRPSTHDDRAQTLHAVEVDDRRGVVTQEGLWVLKAFDRASQTAEQRLPHHETLQLQGPVSTDEATMLLRKHGRLPADAPDDDFGVFVRFAKFLLASLSGVYHFDLYESASATLEAEGRHYQEQPHTRMHNYRALAFFVTKIQIASASKFAAAAAPPPTDEHCDESSRLDQLSLSFENLRTPFVFFSGHTYEFVAAHDVHLFTHVDTIWNTQKAPSFDGDFHAFAVEASRSRDKTLLDCLRALATADSAKDAVEPMQRLLPVLGLRPNFGIKICNAYTELAACLKRHRLTVETEFAFAPEALQEGSAELQALSRGWSNRVREAGATINDFVKYTEEWLLSLTPSPNCGSQPFVLTQDSFVRALAIKNRLQCGIPVVLQGETGQGKTHLLEYLSRVSGTLFEIINIHRGVTIAELSQRIEAVEAKLAEVRERLRDTGVAPIAIVVLDEVNSMENVWIAKSLVCDRLIQGRTVAAEINFVCIMNPWRRRAANIVHGLDFVPSANDQHRSTLVQEHLVYDVHRSPEAFMSVVWDFGLAHNSVQDAPIVQRFLWKDRVAVPPEMTYISDEHIFAESCFTWHLQKLARRDIFDDVWTTLRKVGDNNGNRHFAQLRALCVMLVDAAQDFMRTIDGECAVSLRDISRTMALIPFVFELQFRHAECHNVALDVADAFPMLQRSVSCAFILNYVLRLPDEKREEIDERLRAQWTIWRNHCAKSIDASFLPCPQRLYVDFDTVAEKVCEQLVVDEGMAVNCALKENVMSLFSAIMHPSGNLSQIIVGRPGSTKSASLDALVASSDRACTDERGHYFRNWKPIKKFVIQCTRETTAAAILRVARSAALQQRSRETSGEPVQCVLVLEEVGIAVGSRHNPLMVLHSLIDRGVTLDDGTTVKLPIIGISNYSLDAAKMNRMRVTYRGSPSLDDLKSTARTLMRQQATRRGGAQLQARGGAVGSRIGAPDAEKDDSWVDSFCTVFRDVILSNNAEPSVKWFYGMRDFYSFVSMMKRHLDAPLVMELSQNISDPRRTFFSHLVKWCLEINFGGHPKADVDRRVQQKFIDGIFGKHDLPPSHVAWSTEDVGDGAEAADGKKGHLQLCDMCARIAWYSNAPRHQEAADLFDYARENRSAVPCPHLDAGLSAREVLSYALHRTAPHVSRLYRVRNVVLFSRGNSAVELLFRLGVVKREDAEVIDPRDPSQITPEHIMNDLARVRRCLRTSKTLVLVRATHLYEAMFDVLNQHFTVEERGDEHVFWSTLTMDGFTSAVRVSPDHRIILVEEEAQMESLTSPFLNRCIKVHLGFETALSANQRRLYDRLQIIFIKDETQHALARLFVPGFTPETLASFALQTELPSPCTNNDIKDAVDAAWEWLRQVACPRRVYQALHRVLPSVPEDTDDATIELWNTEHPLRSIRDFFASQYEQDLTVERHLLLFTEQRELKPRRLAALLSPLLDDAVMHPHDPLMANYEMDDVIDHFVAAQPPAGGDSFGVCLVDLSAAAGDTITAARLDSVVHRVAARCPKTRRIVVIALLASTANPKSNPYENLAWCLTHRSEWSACFVDEVLPPDPSPIEAKLLVDDGAVLDEEEDDDNFGVFDDEPAVPLQQAQPLSAEEQFERALSKAMDFVRDARLRVIAQRLGVGDQVSAIETAIKDCMASEMTATLLRRLMVAGHRRYPDLLRTWRRVALRQVVVAESLREQLTTFLVNTALFALQHVLPALFEGRSFEHASNPNQAFRDMFAQLVESPLIPVVDYSTCLRDTVPDAASTVGTADLLRTAACQFPFSLQLRAVLEAAPSIDALAAQARRLVANVDDLDRSLVIAYATDMIQTRGDVSPFVADCLARLMLVCIRCAESREYSDNSTIIDVHRFLDHTDAGWCGIAVDFVKGLAPQQVHCVIEFANTTLDEHHGFADVEATDDLRLRVLDALIDNGADAASGVVPLSRLTAIQHLLHVRRPWKLRLHRALSLLQRAALCDEAAIAQIASCGNPEDVLNVIEECAEVASNAAIIAPELLFDVHGDEDTFRSCVRLVSIAVNVGTVPLAVVAHALQQLIDVWREHDGFPAEAAFGPLYAMCLESPGERLVELVRHCFFTRALIDPRHFNQLKRKVVAMQRRPAVSECAFFRVALAGIDTAAAWQVASKLLNDGHATMQQLQSFSAHFTECLASNDDRKASTAMYFLRALYAASPNIDALKDLLAQDLTRQQPILPTAFRDIEVVEQVLATSPPPSILYSVHGYREAFEAISVKADQAPATASDAALGAVVFADIASPATRGLTALLRREGQRRTAIAFQSPAVASLSNELKMFVALVASYSASGLLPAVLAFDGTVDDVFGPLPPARSAPNVVASYRAMRLIQLSAALIQAATRGNRPINAAAVQDCVTHVQNEIITIKCPRCRLPFDGFDGCFSVSCNCGQVFCGWCLAMMADAHAHAPQCALNPRPGQVHGTMQEWEIANNKRRVAQMRAYLAAQPQDVQSAAFALLLPDLKKYKIDPAELGAIRPVFAAEVIAGMLPAAAEALSQALFKHNNGVSLAMWWIAHRLALNAAERIIDNSGSLEDLRVRVLTPQNVDTVRGDATAAQAASLGRAVVNSAREALVESESYRRQLPPGSLERHYLMRRYQSPVETLWARVYDDDSLTLLRPLHEAATAEPPYLVADANARYERILHFIADLQTACTVRHITRREAGFVKLADFIREASVDDPSLSEDRLRAFTIDVRELWAPVERILCKTKQELVAAGVAPDVFEPKDVTLNMLLPGTDVNSVDGGFILAVLRGRGDSWKGLTESAMGIHNTLKECGIPDGGNANRRFFRLRATDLIEYDDAYVTEQLLPFYVDPITGDLDADLSQLIHQVAAQPGLRAKPRLMDNDDYAVPPYVYCDESASAVVLFNQRHPFEELPADAKEAVGRLWEADDEFAEAARSFLLVFIRELASRSARARLVGNLEMALRTMATPLLPAQAQARESLLRHVGSTLRTTHLIPLLAAVSSRRLAEEAQVEPSQPLLKKFTEQLHEIVSKLVEEGRDALVERLLDVATITAVVYLQPGTAFPPNYFEASILDLVCAVRDEEQFTLFEPLDEPGTLRHFLPLIRIIRESLERLREEAMRPEEVAAPPPAAAAARPNFALRLPVTHDDGVAEEAERRPLDAAAAAVRGVTPRSGREVPHAAQGRGFAGAAFQYRAAAAAASIWKVDPSLEYGSFD